MQGIHDGGVYRDNPMGTEGVVILFTAPCPRSGEDWGILVFFFGPALKQLW